VDRALLGVGDATESLPRVIRAWGRSSHRSGVRNGSAADGYGVGTVIQWETNAGYIASAPAGQRGLLQLAMRDHTLQWWGPGRNAEESASTARERRCPGCPTREAEHMDGS